MPRRLQVSPARLNLLRDCPRCFWREVVQGVKRPDPPFPTLPARFDQLIKAYCKPYRGGATLPPLLAAAGLEGRLLEPKLPTWTDPTTGLVVAGHLDELVETPSGALAPLDHKTRGYDPTGVHPSYQLQLDVYTLLLQGNGLTPAEHGYLVYYVPQDGALEDGIRMKLEVRRLLLDPHHALGWVQRASETLAAEVAPEASAECSYCRWASVVSGG